MSQPHSSPPRSRWTRTRIAGLIVLLLVAAGVVWFLMKPAATTAPGGRPGMRGGPPGAMGMNMPIPVKAATARAQDMPIYLQSLGTVTAYNTVTVRSRVGGELVKVAFDEGQRVKAGDLLAQIDPRAFEVALAQAQGTQQQNVAQLENARRDLQRYQTLFKQDSIARQQVDTQLALVRQYEGTLKSDQAAVNSAKLQLDYARITAPISGRLGLRQVDVGNLIASSDTAGLVVITQTQPIAVMFTIPETQLPEVLKQLRSGATLLVDAYDRANTRKVASGTLETLDNQIDVATGTVKLKARFENADESLFPNQFVNMRLLVQTRENATAIPTVAVQQGATGAFVFVVKADNTIEVRTVELGPIYNDMVAVNKGLNVGEVVVTEGTDRLRNESKVQVMTDAAAAIPAATGNALGGGTPPGADGSTTQRRRNPAP
ncbi:MdtA/MuxA family multidrug efflux RND transporter periplasmic adaptor subunit [Schauerella aestuarii]|uniref:MdtA/MuxA family multidrug efflux RND transporter periplasmic adaptor subunit n=1 Tax=Schauerella aestuarii TaxID=2511204 RepID=UPI00136ADF0B|nr:MdtA/MuxA family multidrug efflux RND transporter periplasmic adaptor subunit [Achromobacter aestuarii]MYZ44291.1 MdtA/MuxA family multidrug efflux RND transporter periplasmic adaptor subunit [Achromobacter aestuarii]